MCSLDVAFTTATVRKLPQPFADGRVSPVWPCLWRVLQKWSLLEFPMPRSFVLHGMRGTS